MTKKKERRCCVATDLPDSLLSSLNEEERKALTGGICTFIDSDAHYLTVRTNDGFELMVPHRLVRLVILEKL